MPRRRSEEEDEETDEEVDAKRERIARRKIVRADILRFFYREKCEKRYTTVSFMRASETLYRIF